MSVEKLDLKKIFKPLYSAPEGKPIVVEVPALDFLMVDGAGDPNASPQFEEAVGALYAVAYALKFMFKRSEHPVEYTMMPLEGLWWAADMAAFTENNRAQWQWTAMIMQPSLITRALIDDVMPEVRRKKPSAALERLRFERFAEGRAAQIMHVGPYTAEAENIARLHAFIAAEGGVPSGKHHEIYIGDARRSPPERLRTIIRQPFST